MVNRFALLIALAAPLAACDATEPPRDAVVLQAFIETGQPLPDLSVSRTGQLDGAVVPVLDAEAAIQMGASLVRYLPVLGDPGVYRPARPRPSEAGEGFVLEVIVGGSTLRAAGTAPPPIALDSVWVEPSPTPVRAAFADSLGGGIREGFLYPVDVTLFWTAPPDPDTSWVRARLRPPGAFPSAVVDFLLRVDETQPEALLRTGDPSLRQWRGVYAVPVGGAESPLPPHELEVSLLRSGTDYARFALSRTEPGLREPVGNVRGGLGIVAGVAVHRRAVMVGG